MTGHIVRWEVMRHLRNKQFLLGLFITPVLIALFVGIPVVLERVERPQERTYAVVDDVGGLELLRASAVDSGLTFAAAPMDMEGLEALVRAGDVDGYFVLDDTFLQTGRIEVHVEKLRPRPPALDAALTAVLQTMRMQARQIDPEVLSYVSAPPRIESTPLTAEEGNDPMGGLAMAGVFAFLLFFLIMSSGTMLLQSAVQEKRDRMSEVVLSSVNADTLMLGKIVGHFILGALQIGFWLAIGLPVAQFVLGAPVGEFLSWQQLPVLASLALLGYLFYAALFVGIGATMEDIQSASNSQGIVFMLPVLSFVFLNPVLSNPEGVIARVATYFPVTTPMIGTLRYGMGVMTGLEAAAAVGVLLASTWIVIRVASRLFRTGMLMYGKNATLKEIWRWLRHPA